MIRAARLAATAMPAPTRNARWYPKGVGDRPGRRGVGRERGRRLVHGDRGERGEADRAAHLAGGVDQARRSPAFFGATPAVAA